LNSARLGSVRFGSVKPASRTRIQLAPGGESAGASHIKISRRITTTSHGESLFCRTTGGGVQIILILVGAALGTAVGFFQLVVMFGG
jgi:hypothetical protein